jgi:DNA-binding transcriptional LysR family regulator
MPLGSYYNWNYTEAAERLYMTQSSISKNILALEKELGVSLFDRSSRPYVLSPAGSKLMVHFKEILLAFERTDLTLQEIKRCQQPLENNIFRIAGMPAMTRFGVTSSIHSFVHGNPCYNVSLQEMDEDCVLLALQMGDCDIAFCSNLRLNFQDYSYQKYSADTISIVFSKDNPIAQKDAAKLSDLSGQYWVFPPPQAPHYNVCLHACHSAGFKPNIRLTTDRPHTALEYVHGHSENCMYIEITGIVKNYMTDSYAMRPAETPHIEFYFAWRRNVPLPKAAIDYLQYMTRTTKCAPV